MKPLKRQIRILMIVLLGNLVVFAVLYVGLFLRFRFQAAKYREEVQKIQTNIQYFQENAQAVSRVQELVQNLQKQHQQLRSRFVTLQQLPMVLQQTAEIMRQAHVQVLKGNPLLNTRDSKEDTSRVAPVELSWQFAGTFLPLVHGLSSWQNLPFYQQVKSLHVYRHVKKKELLVADVVSQVLVLREKK